MRSSFSKKSDRATRGYLEVSEMMTKWAIIAAVALVAIVFIVIVANSASFRRSLVDFRSDMTGGLNRTIRVYTANGDLLAEYTGKIDLEATEGGYVKFDFEGKRYTYYNCFVESIADIE